MKKIFTMFILISSLIFSDEKDDTELTYSKVTQNYAITIDSFLKVNNVSNYPVIRDLILNYSSMYNVNPYLVVSMIKSESSFKQKAISPVGAIGIMQIMPDTAKYLKINPYNLEENIKGGVKYISEMLNVNNKNIPLALASYNAGLGAVQKYGGIPPYAETQNYVKDIVNTFDFLHDLARRHGNANIQTGINNDEEKLINADMELYKQLYIEDQLIKAQNEDEFIAQSNIIWFDSLSDIDNAKGDLTYTFTTLRYYYDNKDNNTNTQIVSKDEKNNKNTDTETSKTELKNDDKIIEAEKKENK